MLTTIPSLELCSFWLLVFIVLGHIASDHGEKLKQQHALSLSWGYIAFCSLYGVLLLLNFLNILTYVAGVDTALLLTIAGGYRIFSGAVKGLLRGKISLDFIVFVAAIAALALGEFIAAAEVIFIMLIGEGLEDYTVRRARNAIKGLVNLEPRAAHLRTGSGSRDVPIGDVHEGDVVIVRPGEHIPVDGAVIAGQSSVNQSTITGESISVGKTAGDTVFTGTLNELGLMDIRVTAVGPDTVLSKIIHLVEAAQERKAPVQRAADRFAKWFLPAVLVIAGGAWYFTGDVIRAVAVLIIACPCAMVLATPAAVVAGIGRLARDGILVKGGEFLETIGKTTCAVFDKTGTLTRGQPVITAIHPFGERTENDVLSCAAAAEQHSNHILADVIVRTAQARGLSVPAGDNFLLIPGMGVEVQYNGAVILAGNRRLFTSRGIDIPNDIAQRIDAWEQDGQTLILVADGAGIAGVIALEDTLREHVRNGMHELQHLGVGRLVLLTGDNERVARRIARQAGIPEFHADLLPGGKVDHIRALQEEGHRVIMIGDGINDAPALAAADVGIAMAGVGADITADAADIVFMTGDLQKLPEAIRMGRRTLQIIRQNLLYFAVMVNLAGMGAASLGWLTPVMAAVAHQAGSLLVILNSLRLLSRRRLRDTQAGRWWLRTAHRLEHAAHDASQLRPRDAAVWIATHQRPVGYTLLTAIVLLMLNSSLYVVESGRSAVVRRFGRITGNHVPPGLHCTWPWPVGDVTIIQRDLIRRCEIGFRTTTDGEEQAAEPAAYEWNLQHRGGRYRKVPEEALVLTGDENLLEFTMVVQYIAADAAAWLFRIADPEALVAGLAESAARNAFGVHTLDDVLTTERPHVQSDILALINRDMISMGAGIRIVSVELQDVHPPLEVVDAFRDVSSALEEKDRLINDAEGYRNEQLPLARGESERRLIEAQAYTIGKINRAQGDADKFRTVALAYRTAPDVTRTRLYLETAETVLAGARKHILDGNGSGGRRFLFMDRNVTVPADQLANPPFQFYPPATPPE